MTEDRYDTVTILSVEDDPDCGAVFEILLKRKFSRIFCAASAEEGLRIFEEQNPDIVISDIRLSGAMDGLALVKEMRRRNPELFVVLTTAFNSLDYFKQAVQIGVDGFIEKPYGTLEMLEPVLKCAERIRDRRKLKETTELALQYKEIVDAGILVVKLSLEGKISFVNDVFCRLLGYRREEVLGRNAAEFLEDEGSALSLSSAWQVIRKKSVWHGIIKAKRADGGLVYSQGVMMPMTSETGETTEIISLSQDISDLVRAKEILEEEKERFRTMSITDPLTGIHNRQKFTVDFEYEYERSKRYGEPFSLILFDIDNFKNVNDWYGHQKGDEVLRAISGIVARSIRKADLFARIGGEEFAVLMVSTDWDGACTVAEKLRKLVEGAKVGDFPLPTCSFGVAQLRSGESREHFFRRADDTLYEAKRRGRNRVVCSESCTD